MSATNILNSLAGLAVFIPLSVLVGILVVVLLSPRKPKPLTTKSFCGDCLKETIIVNGICTTCNNKKVYHDD